MTTVKVYILGFFSTREHSICLAHCMLSPVRPSVRHTGESYKNG